MDLNINWQRSKFAKKNSEFCLKYDPKNEVDYYLDTSLLLNEYYDQKNEVVKENKEITVLDFMNKKKEEPEQNNDIVNEYMSIIDDTILNTSSTALETLCGDTSRNNKHSGSMWLKYIINIQC